MTKTLNQPKLRFDIGKGIVQAENRITVKNEEGERKPGKSVPVHLITTEISKLMDVSKVNRKYFDIDVKDSKGGGDYSVNSTYSTFFVNKNSNGEEKHHENK